MSISHVVPGEPVGAVGNIALSGMTLAIRSLYQIAGGINDFIDDHIEQLKRSANPLVASTGRVLEAAKVGFAVGYMSSVAIIAVGQYLLGNTLAAVAAVGSAALLSNPIAMTCAAIGAIYYGWNALTDSERVQILVRLGSGLDMGIELIRSMVEFAIRKSRELMTSSQLEDFKAFVKTQAALFGKSLYDVTHKVGDAVKGGVETAGEFLVRAGDAVADGAGIVYDSTTEAGGKLLETIKKTVQRGEPDKIPVAGSIVPLALSDPQKTTAETPIRKTLAKPKSKTPIRKTLAKPQLKP